MEEEKPIRNLVVVSDTHCGCQLGLCPPTVELDGGGHYNSSRLQNIVWNWWLEFWYEWVPHICHGEPFAVVFNGDLCDGSHHGSVTQITHNIKDQERIAISVLQPIAERAAAVYVIRGTEAHVGKSAQYEEATAKELGAIPDETGTGTVVKGVSCRNRQK